MVYNILIGIASVFFIWNTIRLSKQNGEFAFDEAMAGCGIITIIVVFKLIAENIIH